MTEELIYKHAISFPLTASAVGELNIFWCVSQQNYYSNSYFK